MARRLTRGKGWAMYERCKCPKCGRYHTDAVRDPYVPDPDDGFLPIIRQECNGCLEARAGKDALQAYLRWRARVI